MGTFLISFDNPKKNSTGQRMRAWVYSDRACGLCVDAVGGGSMSLCIQGDLGQNAREALRLEWLDTNGIGGYASSTILHCHTRKYHGLLVASLKEPAGRFVLLSK